MAIVINEFEVVPQDTPAAADANPKRASAPADAKQESLSTTEFVRVARQAHARALRVLAH